MSSRQFLLWPCQFCLDMAARSSLIGADDIGDMACPTPLEQCCQLVQTLSAAPFKRIQIHRNFISRDSPHWFALHSYLAPAWTRRIWRATRENRLHLRFFHAGARHPSPGMVFPQHPQMTPASPCVESLCQQIVAQYGGCLPPSPMLRHIICVFRRENSIYSSTVHFLKCISRSAFSFGNTK